METELVDAIIVNGQAVENEHPIWGAKIITDLSVGFKITEAAKIVVGANNIFDIYPDHLEFKDLQTY